MADKEVVRVMVVDDHDVVRRGLAILIQAFDDLTLVGEACDGAEALTRCAEVRPDVVLMDIVMPEMDGIAATRAIRETHPEIQVVGLTSFKDDPGLKAILQAGAFGCLSKSSSIDELADTVRAAHTRRVASANRV